MGGVTEKGRTAHAVALLSQVGRGCRLHCEWSLDERSELWKCAGCSGLPASEWALSTVLNHPRPAHMNPHVCPRELVQAEAQEHIVGADKGQLNAQFYAQGKLWQGVGMKPITCQK